MFSSWKLKTAQALQDAENEVNYYSWEMFSKFSGMGKSFQDYSLIQDYEAESQWKPHNTELARL